MKTKNRTKSLVTELAQDMHFALIGMQQMSLSMIHWRKLGRVLLLVSLTSDERVARLDRLNIEAAILTLDRVGCRRSRAGTWEAREDELVCIARGTLAAERVLSRLDKRKLHFACEALELLSRIA